MATFIPIIVIVIGFALCYLCGSIPVGLIVGRLTRGVDIREHGSGNVGTTNAIRILGLGPGIVVMCGDILKGVLGVLLMFWMLRLGDAWMATIGSSASGIALASGWVHDLAAALALVGVVLGHMFSPFMRFKGGKGIATAFGALCVVLPWSALICLIIFAGLIAITRYVSLGSICADISLPISCAAINPDHPVLIGFCVIVCLLILYAHRGNISRLAHGTERKFSVAGKNKGDTPGSGTGGNA